MKKLTKRKKQALNSKKRLLEAAIQLIDERGFNNVTIQDISSKAGMSVGNFYNYFQSKDSIILALYGLSDDYFDQFVIPKLLESDQPVIEKIGEFAQEQVAFGLKYGIENIAQLYRIQITHNTPDFYSNQRGLVAGMIKLIQSGQEKGELLNTISAEQISQELLLIIRGVILDWLWTGTIDPKHQASYMVKQYLKIYSSSIDPRL